MKRIFFPITLITLLLACGQEPRIQRVNVADFGILANSGESITGKINELIDSLGDEDAMVVFPEGRYDFYPDSNYLKTYHETNTYDVNPKRLAVFIEKKKNITIDGQGSSFIFHGHMQPFTLDNSEGITIKNVNIDWDRPLTAESEVLEADSKHILIKIDTTQFPYRIHEKGLTFTPEEGLEEEWRLTGGSWLIEFTQEHIIPAHTGDQGCVRGDLKNVGYRELEPGIVLMEGDFTKTPIPGNHLVMRHSTRDHAGLFCFHSKDIQLEDINVYHTSGLGVLFQYCENITARRVNLIPNPEKNRYLSGHDDGLHFMGCKGEIVIDDCDGIGLMDDPINIHGTYVPITDIIDATTVKCTFKHDMSQGLIWAQPGDDILFIDNRAMTTVGGGKVAGFELLDEKTFTLQFQDAIPDTVATGIVLENLSWTPDVTITHCYAGSNRARGYLISTPGKVLIENNIFETSGSAILIAGDARYWYESGATKDITIRNNEFRSACNSSSYQYCHAVISIFPEISEPDPQRPYHQNIRIENNSFNPFDYPILYAFSVDGLKFTDNAITRSYNNEPWRSVKHTFLLDACRNVVISGNDIAPDVLGKNILLRRMSPKELHLTDEVLTVEQDPDIE
jgi:hypothetical protein